MEQIYKETFKNLIINPQKAFSIIIENKLDKYEKTWISGLSFPSLISSIFLIAHFLGFKIGGYISVFLIAILITPIFPFVVLLVGKWMNGKATKPEINSIFSYGRIPLYFSIIIYFSCIFVCGFNTHTNLDNINIYRYGNVSYYLYVIGCYMDIALVLLTLLYLIIGFSIAQRFSILKSALNVLLASILIGVPLAFIRILIRLF
ncbi:MAG TPA: hypothetical protein VIH57_18160 [Bacteroidales bacterium]